MGQISVSVGDFNKTSTGTTVYGATVTFNIPENAGITGCTTTFVTHVNSGSFQDKAFTINGQRASDAWISSNGSLNYSLLVTGSNTFRVTMKAQAGKTATWSISNIQLHITYNDPSGGSGSVNIGTFGTNTGRLTAGEQIRLTLGACDPSISREISVWYGNGYNSQVGTVPGIFDSDYHEILFTVPESWCETIAPNANSANIMFYLSAYRTAGGALQGTLYNIATVDVPLSAIPTIEGLTAERMQNGIDASITNYVQNYSGVKLTINNAAGALGSTIVSQRIAGGGLESNVSPATFSPLPSAGEITFTAEITDSRGRKATATTTITVLEYTPPSGINLSAFRSDNAGNKADEGTYAALSGKRVFSPLGTQNTATIKGCVYEKNTTPPALSNMSDDVTLILGGSLSIEKAYIAYIEIADKITSVAYIIEIPTSIVGLHILPGATGAGIGMYGVQNKLSSRWPIYVGDDRVALQKECPHRIGDVIFSIVSDNPAATWPATAWTALPTGKFIRVGTGGNMGGNDVHAHGAGTLTAKITTSGASLNYWYVDTEGWNTNWQAPISGSGAGTVNTRTNGVKVGGLTDNADNIPQYFELYAWRRTA